MIFTTQEEWQAILKLFTMYLWTKYWEEKEIKKYCMLI